MTGERMNKKVFLKQISLHLFCPAEKYKYGKKIPQTHAFQIITLYTINYSGLSLNDLFYRNSWIGINTLRLSGNNITHGQTTTLAAGWLSIQTAR